MVQLARVAAITAVCLGAAGMAQALSFPKLPLIGGAHGERLKPGEWPQAQSDVTPDPAVRFGALPNGMRYAILRNAAPAGQVSLRLRIAAGSLNETDGEQGLAHFLEHMAFDGSKAVPDGEMDKILERHGLVFGADSNAETTFDSTLYKLDLPKADDDSIDTAMMLLRETASELTLAPAAIDRERGVVLAEERTRDTPAYNIFTSRLAFLLEGQRPPIRFPIGQAAVIQKADHAALAAFYAKYYRPERATLVVTGDIDPAAMEAKIRAQFGSWRANGPAGADPEPGAVEKRGAQTRLLIEPGGPTSLQLSWVTPPDASPDSVAKRKADLIEQLGLEVLDHRLATLARADDPPFISAGAWRNDEAGAAQVTSLLIGAEAESWQKALSAADQEQRRIVRDGVHPDELSQVIADTEADMRQDAAQTASRPTPELADALIQSAGDGEVYTNTPQDLALFEETVKTVTPDQVNAALKAAFTGNGPLLYMSSPVAIDGGEAAVKTAFDTANAADISAASAMTVKPIWPYADFGDPGKVAEQRDIPDLNAVFVRFENGVRLTIKPTKFSDDQVLVKVRAGGGLTALPSDQHSPSWASGALIEGGLGKISAGDLERSLAGDIYSAGFQVEDDAFDLSGATRRDDLDTQMQVLAAYVSDPAWRPAAFQRAQLAAATLLDQYAHTDFGVLARDLPGLIHSSDQRWAWPARAEMAAASVDDLKRQTASMQTGPIEVVVVGDITVEKAIDAVAATFGALPARAAPAPATPIAPVRFPLPASTPVILTHAGRADQAIGLAAWPSSDFFADPHQARAVSVLAEVLRLRLIEQLRQTQGVVYAPEARDSESLVWPGFGYISASVEIPPDKLDGFYTELAKICADLRDHDITADELDRARGPRLESAAKAQQTNVYWLASLSGAQTDPRRLAAIRSQLADYDRITPADIRRVAGLYLRDDKVWKLEVKPGAP